MHISTNWTKILYLLMLSAVSGLLIRTPVPLRLVSRVSTSRLFSSEGGIMDRVSESQRYLMDLNGYVVVKNVFTKVSDECWLVSYKCHIIYIL